MTRDEIGALLDRHQEAFARRDADALAAQHAEEGTFESPAHGVVARPRQDRRHLPLLVHRLSRPAASPRDRPSSATIAPRSSGSSSGTAHGPFFGIAGAGHPDRNVGRGRVRARGWRNPERQAHLRFLGCADEDRRVEGEARLTIADCGLWIVDWDCVLRIADCGFGLSDGHCPTCTSSSCPSSGGPREVRLKPDTTYYAATEAGHYVLRCRSSTRRARKRVSSVATAPSSVAAAWAARARSPCLPMASSSRAAANGSDIVKSPTIDFSVWACAAIAAASPFSSAARASASRRGASTRKTSMTSAEQRSVAAQRPPGSPRRRARSLSTPRAVSVLDWPVAGRESRRHRWRQDLVDTQRLGHVLVHAGGEEAFAIAFHGVRRHRDDRDMAWSNRSPPCESPRWPRFRSSRASGRP